MSTVMEIVNAPLRWLFDLLLWPFQSMHPLVGLTVVSFLAALGMLWGYAKTSDQEGIERTKRKIAAGLFEIRLFNDDLRAILRAQGSILRHNLTYMRLNIVPMLWMIVPFVLVVAQMQFHYGFRGLETGEPTILAVTLHEDATSTDVSVEVPEGLRLDSPRVWIPTLRQAAWRLVAEQEGTYDVRVHVADETVTKRVVVSDDVLRRSPERLAPGFLGQLIYPAEPPLANDSAVAEISLDYADREVGLWGWDSHWLISFLILSIALAFALKGRFGVTI